MRTFKHVLYTWLLSHLLHAFLFCLADYIQSGSLEIALFAAPLLLGPIVSIPALLVSWFLLRLIVIATAPNLVRVGLWFLSTVTALVCNLCFFYLIGHEPFTNFMESFAVYYTCHYCLLTGYTTSLTTVSIPLHF